MAAKLEEALLSIRLDWDLSTPAKEIVEKVREQDLSLIRSYEGKCKDQVLTIAFKLVRGMKIPAVVALLLLSTNGRSSNLLNSVLRKENSITNVAPIKKFDGGVSLIPKMVDNHVGDVVHKRVEPVTNALAKKIDGVVDPPEGTIVDLVLGMALAHSNSCILNKLGTNCKSYVKECDDLWQTKGDNLVGNSSSSEVDANLGYAMEFKRLEDLDSGTSANSVLKDFSKWDESFQSLKLASEDSSDWEEVTHKSRKKSSLPSPAILARDVIVDNKLRRSLSGSSDVEKSTITTPSYCVTTPIRDNGEYNCEIARKLLECLLIFGPRLSGHTQSPHLPPLLRVAKENDETLVCLLLDVIAPSKLQSFVNEKDADGNTALHWALRQATPLNRRIVNSQVVRRLLKAGANVMIGNKLGATPVHTAAGHGHFEALSDILEKDSSGVNVLALTKETPLHYAVKNNHLACVFLLLKHGANRNVASSRNQKPIQLAPSLEMKALLLQDDNFLKENTWESFKPILLNATSLNSPLYALAMQSQTQYPSIVDAFGFHQTQQDGSPTDWLSAQTLAINSRDFNLGGEMDMFGGKESVNLPQYKTVMCRFSASSEGCVWGSKCHFAHSEGELVGVERMDGQSTGVGGSSDGSDQAIKNFKTKLCTHHEKIGKCPHGSKCTFAHGMIELRGALSSTAICIKPLVGIDTQPSSANSLGSSIGSEKGDDYVSARKVFVGGLPHFIQSDELWEFFEAEFGKVVDAVVICGVDADGKVRSRGFGFVVFHDPTHANVAITRHYLPFRGKKVEVKRATARVDYGDDPIKFNLPAFSLGMSSLPPTSSSHSPTFEPSSPIIGMSKEPSFVPLAVPQQQAWSIPPSALESLRKPSLESNQPSPSNSIFEHASSLDSEIDNHLGLQHNVPLLSHLSLDHGSDSSLQNDHTGQFHSFGPLFSQNNCFSSNSRLDGSPFLLDSNAVSSPSHGFTSPNASSYHHHRAMNGSSVPYSSGSSLEDTSTRVKEDMDHQSFFSSTLGHPLLYPYGCDPVAPIAPLTLGADDEEEFSELLAILQGEKA